MQLYKISFKTSGKAYIGISSVSAESRFKVHSTKFKHLIGKAFKKYGKDDAELTVLAEHDDWNVLCQMEITAIIEHGTRAPVGYNLTDGGEGTVGVIYTEEQKKLASEKSKLQFSNPEVRQAQAERARIQFSTLEARKAMSEIKKAWIAANPEEWAKNRAKAKETLSTNEARKANSERAKLQFLNLEARKAASEKSKLQFSTNEARQAASERTTLHFLNPEARKVQSEKTKMQFSNPEARKAASEKSKLQFSTPEGKARQKCAIAVGFAKKAGRPFSYLPREQAA
jgi:hypothetical protein